VEECLPREEKNALDLSLMSEKEGKYNDFPISAREEKKQ